jgi:hypothetical protein
MLHRGQAFEATKFFRLTPRGDQSTHPEIDRGTWEEGHDASRSRPPRHDLEGGRYVDPPESPRPAARRRVHDRAGVTTRLAADAVEHVAEAR